MTTIYADFNARIDDEHVALNTKGSLQSLEHTGAIEGDWVWVSDGEVRARAQIEKTLNGLVAKIAWVTLEHIQQDDEPVPPCRYILQELSR